MFEGDGDFEVFEDAGDDFVFGCFGVLDCEGVVVMHYKDCVAAAPDVEHAGVHDEGFGGLGIVGECVADELGIVAASPELALAAVEGDDSAATSKLVLSPLMP